MAMMGMGRVRYTMEKLFQDDVADAVYDADELAGDGAAILAEDHVMWPARLVIPTGTVFMALLGENLYEDGDEN